jgi:hypothetical protein
MDSRPDRRYPSKKRGVATGRLAKVRNSVANCTLVLSFDRSAKSEMEQIICHHNMSKPPPRRSSQQVPESYLNTMKTPSWFECGSSGVLTRRPCCRKAFERMGILRALPSTEQLVIPLFGPPTGRAIGYLYVTRKKQFEVSPIARCSSLVRWSLKTSWCRMLRVHEIAEKIVPSV